ncbi:MAG: tetratricopeptide repeat protein, partial [Polyangiaceae bacterium]
IAPVLVAVPIVAWGESGRASPRVKNAASSSAAPRAYTESCAQGNAKYASRDFAGAIDLYRKAIESSPHKPLGHYLLGEAQLAAGNLTEADASWSRAALESGDQDPAMRARILFVIADLKEREKKWDDAKAAWQVYADWAARYPDAGAFPQSAQSREQVISTMLAQDKAYEIVRERIARTADGGVFTTVPKAAKPAK